MFETKKGEKDFDKKNNFKVNFAGKKWSQKITLNL